MPLDMDDRGLRPDALAAAQRRARVRVIYCQPTLHNPLGVTMPKERRAETFVTAAARQGIAITPASAFVAGPGHAPNAVRLALGSPPPEVLAGALRTLAGLARSGPQAWSAE